MSASQFPPWPRHRAIKQTSLLWIMKVIITSEVKTVEWQSSGGLLYVLDDSKQKWRLSLTEDKKWHFTHTHTGFVSLSTGIVSGPNIVEVFYMNQSIKVFDTTACGLHISSASCFFFSNLKEKQTRLQHFFKQIKTWHGTKSSNTQRVRKKKHEDYLDVDSCVRRLWSQLYLLDCISYWCHSENVFTFDSSLFAPSHSWRTLSSCSLLYMWWFNFDHIWVCNKLHLTFLQD